MTESCESLHMQSSHHLSPPRLPPTMMVMRAFRECHLPPLPPNLVGMRVFRECQLPRSPPHAPSWVRCCTFTAMPLLRYHSSFLRSVWHSSSPL